MEIGAVYHITTKSIEGYKIFNDETEYLRMKQLIQYYKHSNLPVRYSYFIAWQKDKKGFSVENSIQDKKKLVQIIAYCLMPTHIHLVLEQLVEKGISLYMNKILNGYTRYFNTKHHRKGPLWTGRFKRILAKTDEQLLHLTRYIHLNPVTAYIVNRPEEWRFSSYSEYIGKVPNTDKVSEFKHLLEIKSEEYKKFTTEQISYQRELQTIKHLTLE